MKILHLSDTHNCHHRLRDLPEADVVVHSGDFCMVGTEQEAIDFLNWFCDLPYKHKIFICGNHDDCLYGANIDGLDYPKISDDTDVLITHSPAYGILDIDDGINYGSEEILTKLSDLHLKAHLFGHIHAQHGVMTQKGVTFSNGAIMTADYTKLNDLNVIEI